MITNTYSIYDKFEEYMSRMFPNIDTMRLSDGTYKSHLTWQMFCCYCGGYVKREGEIND